jgi:catechol 2,3-dioxygenase-like lactoylglutathione lyase family enzyme
MNATEEEIFKFNGLKHASFTVSDMARSLAFYRDVLGLEVIFDSVEAGETFKGPELDNLTGCPGSELHIVFLKINEAMLELIQYTPKGKALEGNKASDTGSAHVCLDTENIQALYKKLSENGVNIHFPPQNLGGVNVMYFRDPDGIIIESMQGDPMA